MRNNQEMKTVWPQSWHSRFCLYKVVEAAVLQCPTFPASRNFPSAPLNVMAMYLQRGSSYFYNDPIYFELSVPGIAINKGKDPGQLHSRSLITSCNKHCDQRQTGRVLQQDTDPSWNLLPVSASEPRLGLWELWKPIWASRCWWQRAELPDVLEMQVGSGHGHVWERCQGKDQIRTLIPPSFRREGALGKGCPGAAAGWGERSVNLGLSLSVPSPQLLGEDTAGRAGSEPSIRTCPSVASFAWKGRSVWSVLRQDLMLCFAQFRSAGSVGLCLLLPQDGICSDGFPSLALQNPT